MAHTFASTNDANRAAGHPHFDETASGPGWVELTFTNDANELAVFEYRIDGQAVTDGEPHPVIEDDFVYPTVSVDGRSQQAPVVQTFEANTSIDVRLALGGERDWDFDWTPVAIPAEPPPPPPPPPPPAPTGLDLTAITQAVTGLQSAVTSAITVIQQIVDALRSHSDDQAAVEALAQQLIDSTDALAAAVAANTTT